MDGGRKAFVYKFVLPNLTAETKRVAVTRGLLREGSLSRLPFQSQRWAIVRCATFPRNFAMEMLEKMKPVVEVFSSAVQLGTEFSGVVDVHHGDPLLSEGKIVVVATPEDHVCFARRTEELWTRALDVRPVCLLTQKMPLDRVNLGETGPVVSSGVMGHKGQNNQPIFG